MPFWRNAHIMLANKSSKDFNDITATVITSTTEYPEAQTGYFTTFYHKGMTEYGRDWAFCNYKGAGWFLGVVQSCRLEHYCEGNEHFYIDGNETPQINGTGTEDYYLGCFWPNIRYNTPFAGCVNDVRLLSGGDPNAYLKVFNKDYLVPATYYRFHLEMPIPFYSSMDAFIQHGAESNIQSEYASLAYLYIKNTPVLHEVDFMDVGSPASLSAHAYQSSGTLKKEKLTANYEGNYLYTNITASGFYHRAGETTFTVSIPKENAGIRLRRRTDQGSGPQSAAVYVNGKFAGNWVDPQTNKTLRWFDSEFDIPESLTRNQNSLQIKLVIKNKNAFNDFNYRVLAYNYAD
ncbi:hypothetical protein GCM10023143_01700 [Compostibacter hankyongensis]|uniref:DUF2961 domain-containing protein n=2 Tax=Compostibacter hankyongensis TaxID=1007089 RepID=A0ABP8FCS8_9BACT